MKAIYILNDTSLYHGGSEAVMGYLFSLLDSKKFNIFIENKKNIIEKEIIDQSDIVICNGEGTIHNSKPRAIHLMKVLEYAQKQNKSTILCNTSWFNMTNEFDHVLKRLNQFSVREKLSAEILETKHNIKPEVFLDISYHYKCEYQVKEDRKIRFLKTDFYSKEFNCFVIPNGGSLEDIDFFNMKQHSWIDTLNKFSDVKVVLTGRYHGLIACLKTKTRFIVYPGNTDKINGLLYWFGNDTALIKNYKLLLSSAKTSHRNLNYYKELFYWVEEQKPWLPYFLKRINSFGK